MSAILADVPVPSRPASRSAHDGRQLSREPVFGITAVQVLLFLLMLWKLPSYETYGSAQGNSLRILFLGFMGLTAYYMVQGSAVDALSMFMAVNLFEPAIQIEGWLPNKFMLAYIGACTLILAFKHRPVRMGPEVILCFLVSALMLLNVLMSSGEEQLLINWAFYLMAGGVFCAFCKGLSLTPRHIRGLARVGGGSVALMVILSLAASYANDRLSLSDNVFVQSSFRLGYVNLESYNTFAAFAAIGLLLWIIYLLYGGWFWLGAPGFILCGAAVIMSKTLTVLMALGAVAPLFILHATAGRRLWRGVGLAGWLVAVLMGFYAVESDLDPLSIQGRDTDTGSGRLVVWERGIERLATQPMGIGWAEYVASEPIKQRYVDLRGEEYEPIISPHNIILTAFIFSGLVGGALFVTLLGLWARRILGSLKRFGPGGNLACVAVVTLVSHMSMDFWYFTFFLGVMWLYFGSAWQPSQASPSEG